MSGLEQLYRIIWPGPGRIKWKRCLMLSTLTGLFIVIYAMEFHFGDKSRNKKYNGLSGVDSTAESRRTFYLPDKLSFTSSVAANDKKSESKYSEGKEHYAVKLEEFSALTPVSYEGAKEDSEFATDVETDSPKEETRMVPTSNPAEISTASQNHKSNAYEIPLDWKNVQEISFRAANTITVPDGGLKAASSVPDKSGKHLMVLGHYEQLGKTTVNFLLAARLAFLTHRRIVKPFVSDSRFCGLTSGWTGRLRSGTRAFKPFDLYYNVTSMAELFNQMSLADMEYLDSFKNSCSFTKRDQKMTIIYFIYPDDYSSKYLMLSSGESAQIKQALDKSDGWVTCSFLNSRLNIDKRIGAEMTAGKQYCVDPNRVSALDILENKILKNNPCVVFHQWRGTGYRRTHFNLTMEPSPENLLRSLKPSVFVVSEVMRFLKMIGQNFIGIHIRSERQLLWYSLEKWLKCMDALYREAEKIRSSNSLKVFISADIGKFGSDQISSNLNSEQVKAVNKKYNWLVKKLDAVTYSVLRQKHHIWTDRGLVALIQLNILSQASSLITLGAGTFQKWVTDKFKARQEAVGDQTWTITKVCFSEMKNWQDLKISRKPKKDAQ